MEELLAWRYLTGQNAGQAERALAVIQTRYLPVLHGYLRHAGVDNSDERDDLISTGLLKLWQARHRIVCDSEKAGRSLLYTIVGRCMIDRFRAHVNKATVPLEVLENAKEVHQRCTSHESQVYAKILTHQLMTAANCLWLGLDNSLPPATHTRQLLAAQCFYLDKWTLDEVHRLLLESPPAGEPELKVQVLEEWLRHPGVLRYLAYERLCYESSQLLGCILGLRNVSPALVGELWQRAAASAPAEQAFADLSWALVAVAILRYYQCVSPDEIASASNEVVHRWGYSRAQINTLLELTKSRLPFCRETEAIISTLELQAQLAARQILGTPDLWERLAFQYSYLLDLAQKDILERVQPSAKLAGYGLSESTLNSWISGRRLQSKLVRFWKQLYGEFEDG